MAGHTHKHTIEIDTKANVKDVDSLASALSKIEKYKKNTQKNNFKDIDLKVRVDADKSAKELDSLASQISKVAKDVKAIKSPKLKLIDPSSAKAINNINSLGSSVGKLQKNIKGINAKSISSVTSAVNTLTDAFMEASSAAGRLASATKSIGGNLGGAISQANQLSRAYKDAASNAGNVAKNSKNIDSGTGSSGSSGSGRGIGTGGGFGAVAESALISATGKGAYDLSFANAATKQTHKQTVSLWAQKDGGNADGTWKKINESVNKSTATMNATIPAMNAFKASTNASTDFLRDNADVFAGLATKVQALGYTEQDAQNAMMDLSKGVHGAFASLDQYGISEESLKNTGKWDGDEKDLQGYMNAVKAVMGNATDYENTWGYQKAMLNKDMMRGGEKLFSEAMKPAAGALKAFNDFDSYLFDKFGVNIGTAITGLSMLDQGLQTVRGTIDAFKTGMENITQTWKDMKEFGRTVKNLPKTIKEKVESAKETLGGITDKIFRRKKKDKDGSKDKPELELPPGKDFPKPDDNFPDDCDDPCIKARKKLDKKKGKNDGDCDDPCDVSDVINKKKKGQSGGIGCDDDCLETAKEVGKQKKKNGKTTQKNRKNQKKGKNGGGSSSEGENLPDVYDDGDVIDVSHTKKGKGKGKKGRNKGKKKGRFGKFKGKLGRLGKGKLGKIGKTGALLGSLGAGSLLGGLFGGDEEGESSLGDIIDLTKDKKGVYSKGGGKSKGLLGKLGGGVKGLFKSGASAGKGLLGGLKGAVSKGGSKILGKGLAKGIGKVGAKLGAKLGASLIPGIGPIISAGLIGMDILGMMGIDCYTPLINAASWAGNAICDALGPTGDWLRGAWGNTMDWMSSTWDWLSQGAPGAGEAIKNALGGAGDWIKGAWGNTVDWFSGTWDWLSQGAPGFLDSITSSLGGAWNWIQTTFSGVGDFLGGLFGGENGLDLGSIISSLNPIMGIIGKLGSLDIGGALKGAFDWIKSLNIGDIFGQMASAASPLLNVLGQISPLVESAFGWLKDNGPGIWDGICSGAQQLWDIVCQIGDKIKTIIEPLQGAGQWIADTLGLRGEKQDTKSPQENGGNVDVGTQMSQIDGMMSKLQTIRSTIGSIIGETANMIATTIGNMITTIGTSINTVFQQIGTTISTTFQSVSSSINSVITTIVSGFTQVSSLLPGMVSGVFQLSAGFMALTGSVIGFGIAGSLAMIGVSTMALMAMGSLMAMGASLMVATGFMTALMAMSALASSFISIMAINAQLLSNSLMMASTYMMNMQNSIMSATAAFTGFGSLVAGELAIASAAIITFSSTMPAYMTTCANNMKTNFESGLNGLSAKVNSEFSAAYSAMCAWGDRMIAKAAEIGAAIAAAFANIGMGMGSPGKIHDATVDEFKYAKNAMISAQTPMTSTAVDVGRSVVEGYNSTNVPLIEPSNMVVPHIKVPDMVKNMNHSQQPVINVTINGDVDSQDRLNTFVRQMKQAFFEGKRAGRTV